MNVWIVGFISQLKLNLGFIKLKIQKIQDIQEVYYLLGLNYRLGSTTILVL